MKILIVTGGTGGHIYPALALADYIKKEKQAEILFVGNDDRMEVDIIPKAGYPFVALHTSGFSGNVIGKIKAGMQLVVAKQKAKRIIKDFNPDVVIGFGGYVSAPVIMAAHSLKKKVVIHEQNSIAGAANKMVSKYANAIVICYEKVQDEFPNRKVHLLGNPRASVAAQVKTDEAYFKSFELSDDKPRILVVMGSLGSSSVTNIMKDVFPKIKDVNFLYVSGKNNYEEAKQTLAFDNVKVVDYVDQLAIVDKFDLMICRAGATTAAEISAKGICTILIPSPYVAHNHQYYNAKALVDKNSAFMIEEKDLNAQVLYDKIQVVLNNPKLVEVMKHNALENSFPNACEDIYKLMERL